MQIFSEEFEIKCTVEQNSFTNIWVKAFLCLNRVLQTIDFWIKKHLYKKSYLLIPFRLTMPIQIFYASHCTAEFNKKVLIMNSKNLDGFYTQLSLLSKLIFSGIFLQFFKVFGTFARLKYFLGVSRVRFGKLGLLLLISRIIKALIFCF